MSYPSCPALKKRLNGNGRCGQRPFDLTGKRFGHLRVLTYAGPCPKRKSLQWLCQCDCGERRVAPYPDLATGHVTSCGCRRGNATHGQTGTVEYATWISMRLRCQNPKTTCYKDYGGRGITICERWLGCPNGFINFFADMGKRPKGMSLDRINVDGNYEPGNCRWATAQVQSANRRVSKKYKAEHATTPEAETAAIMGVDAII